MNLPTDTGLLKTAPWNPVTGCDRLSAGCDNCYALEFAARLKAFGSPKYQTDGDPFTSGPGFGVATHPDALGQPLRWRKPRFIFVTSMGDLFHPDVPLAFIQDVFAVMAATPQHTYQLLTKRPGRARKLADQLVWPPNLWFGTSVEDERVIRRVRLLRETPAQTRFLSCEPLIGPLDDLDLDGIDWVIVSGESGAQARPVDPDWVRSIRDQCVAAGVPFYFMQWGGRSRASGRDLDRRVWNQMPPLHAALHVHA